jgi:hypothetical protein
MCDWRIPSIVNEPQLIGRLTHKLSPLPLEVTILIVLELCFDCLLTILRVASLGVCKDVKEEDCEVTDHDVNAEIAGATLRGPDRTSTTLQAQVEPETISSSVYAPPITLILLPRSYSIRVGPHASNVSIIII